MEFDIKGDFSRRKFLVASTAGVGCLLGAGKFAESVGGLSKILHKDAPLVPWSIGNYRFNIEEVKKRAYRNFFKYECMGGVICTFLKMLSENIGYPFNSLPLDMFRYGGGGIAGWGTVCGAVNGGSQLFNILTYDRTPSKSTYNYISLINDLLDWYSNKSFPSIDHDGYAKFQNQAQSVSKSPLCHVSVTKWVNTARKIDNLNIRAKSPERADRCAKVTGDVAGYIAQVLNNYYDGKYVKTFNDKNPEYSTCVSCHLDTENAYNPNVKAEMNCITCHEDIVKIDPATHPY